MNTGREKPTKREKLIMLLAVCDIILGFIAVVTDSKPIDVVFGAMVLLSGIWMLIVSLKSSWKSLQSRNWHELPYQVIDTTISMQITSAQYHNKFTPFFKIKYAFQGKSYTRTSNDDLNLPVTYIFATPHKAEKYLEDVRGYKYGKTIFVNPLNPMEAYLKTGLGRNHYGVLLFSGILVTLPLLTFAGMIHWR